MIASFNAETLKMRKRWANWILVGVLLAILVLLGYVISYVVLTNPPKGFRSEVAASVLKKEVFPENLIPNILVGMETIGAAIMIILGGLSIASEYGWVTIQTILIQKPGRLAVLFGKLLALALASLLVSLAVMGLAALTSYFLVKIDGSASNWPPAETIFKGFGALWLELSVWTAFGMFVGLAFRSTAAAIGGGLTYPVRDREPRRRAVPQHLVVERGPEVPARPQRQRRQRHVPLYVPQPQRRDDRARQRHPRHHHIDGVPRALRGGGRAHLPYPGRRRIRSKR